MDRRARFACIACRRLKRKCPKEIPSCSLCLRLEKQCEYSPRARYLNEDISKESPASPQSTNEEVSLQVASSPLITPHLDQDAIVQESTDGFPAMFFLDSEICVKPLLSSELNPGISPPALNGNISTEQLIVYDTYFSTIHQWLPIMSRKRIRQHMIEYGSTNNGPFQLLFHCMKLVSEPLSPGVSAKGNTSYSKVLETLLKVENVYLPSLQLLQSIILISAYEIGHAIYPAAYLRVGHASRLCIMIGLHDRKNSSQLFKDTPTWTAREEERRAWWAVLCFDRITNQGIKGLPLSTPEPSPGELLPSPETPWDEGRVGFNEPLFASAFSNNTSLGSFANVCQAGHILGRVLCHRNELHTSSLALGFRVAEAKQLHHILASLSSHLHGISKDSASLSSSTSTSLALCFSARLILYDLYACNEKYSTDHGRSSEEAEMQRDAMAGIFDVVKCTWQLARQLLDSIHHNGAGEYGNTNPLLCHCLYAAAGESEWLLLEQGDASAGIWLRDIVDLLEVIKVRWHVAALYLSEIYKWPGYNSLIG